MKQWFGKTLQLCGLAALALFPAMHLDAVVASVKALGMAGTGVAFPQDALSTVFNPALGVDIGDRMDIGATWVQSKGRAEISGNLLPGIDGVYKSSRHRNIVDPEFGLNYMVCGSCDFSLGLIAYNKDYLQTGYDRRLPILGTSRLGMEVIQEAVAGVMAMRFDCHAFGVALQFGAQRFKVRGIENFDNAVFSTAPTHVTNRNGDYSFGVGVVLGYTWQPMPGFMLGLAYEPRTHMTRLHSYSGFLENHGRLDLPERYSAGVSLEVMPCLNAALDFQWVRRHSIGSLGNDIPPTLFGITRNRLGGKGGPGFNWRDQPFVRFGLAYEIPCYDLVLRTGFRWTRQPIHSKDTFVNALTLDLVENVFTVGATWTPYCGTELSFFYGHGFNKKLRGTQVISPGLPPVGLGGGLVKIENSMNAVGIAYGVMF